MGSSHSSEKLKIPLYAQSPAVRATSNGVVAPQTTLLCVAVPSAWASTLQVTDALTKQPMFQFKATSFSNRCTLQTPDGRALVSMTVKAFPSGFHVFEGDEQNAVSFDISVEGFGRSVIFANFIDRVSGRLCRIVLAGSPHDHRVVLFYLEFGQPDLVPKPRRPDLANSQRFQAIGRIHRSHRAYLVEAAPGVDLTLLLLMWRVWKQLKHG